MIARFAKRMLTEPDKRLLFKFAYNFGWKGMRAVGKFKKRLKRGEFFPAFLFISITNKCNLSCQGCWSTPTDPPRELSLDDLDHIVEECKKQGSYFFGILGGEPLLHPQLFEIFRRHPDCYFLLFTNGITLTGDVARELRRAGNVSPLISIEGNPEVSDERRGGSDVYELSMQGLENCRRNRLITGVATSVCKSNYRDLATEEFVNEIIGRGAHYLWYYIYRPVGPNPSPELTLSSEEVVAVRRFIVDIRTTAPIAVVDAYWDHQGNALCPAAVGIGHHISPAGDIEPCPPLQFATESIHDGKDLYEIFNNSGAMKRFRNLVCGTTRGCIIMERPDLLKKYLETEGARDSSGRGTGFEELARMTPHNSHNIPGQEIPEKSWVYRFAKKHWFFGFGAYG